MAKKRLKKKNVAIAIGVLAFLSIEVINPGKLIATSKLQNLEYSKESARKIIELGLKNEVLENKYNAFINKNVSDPSFDINNYEYYKNIEFDGIVNVLYVNSLKDKGYLSRDVSNILQTGDEESIKKLLSMDKIVDISDYLSLSYAKLSLIERYIEYKKINGVKYETAVTYVNIGLDEDFYTNYKDVDTFSITMLVNKYNRLKEDFVPGNLKEFPKGYCSGTCPQDVTEVVDAFVLMADDMKKEDLKVYVNSGYRSYKEQEETYEKYTKLYGANYNVAKPGFSEHQTGLAIDLKSGSSSVFKGSKEENWIKENAYKYGFILRYDSSKSSITGYNEPWHIRYVGKEVAEDMKNQKLTFDEYYVRNLEGRR